jgi:hypothetical protein
MKNFNVPLLTPKMFFDILVCITALYLSRRPHLRNLRRQLSAGNGRLLRQGRMLTGFRRNLRCPASVPTIPVLVPTVPCACTNITRVGTDSAQCAYQQCLCWSRHYPGRVPTLPVLVPTLPCACTNITRVGTDSTLCVYQHYPCRYRQYPVCVPTLPVLVPTVPRAYTNITRVGTDITPCGYPRTCTTAF